MFDIIWVRGNQSLLTAASEFESGDAHDIIPVIAVILSALPQTCVKFLDHLVGLHKINDIRPTPLLNFYDEKRI